MFNCQSKNKFLSSLGCILTLCLLFGAQANANVISSTSGGGQTQQSNAFSSPNSSVILDFSISSGDSWDAIDRPSNVLAQCIDGTAITGFEFNDISISTVGNSLFSEAVIYFSDSNQGDDGIRLTIGSNQETSGTQTFNSNGILDISDTGNNDVISLDDNKFYLQLFEKIDDIAGAIDARYTSGTLRVWGIDLTATSQCPFVENSGQMNADLNVQYSSEQQSVTNIGESLSYSILINNSGGETATLVSLENTLSENIKFDNLTCDDGTTTGETSDLENLSLSNIPSGQSLSCNINTTVLRYGDITNNVTISASNDGNSSNNSASITTTGVIRIIPVNNPIALILMIFVLYAIVLHKTSGLYRRS